MNRMPFWRFNSSQIDWADRATGPPGLREPFHARCAQPHGRLQFAGFPLQVRLPRLMRGEACRSQPPRITVMARFARNTCPNSRFPTMDHPLRRYPTPRTVSMCLPAAPSRRRRPTICTSTAPRGDRIVVAVHRVQNLLARKTQPGLRAGSAAGGTRWRSAPPVGCPPAPRAAPGESRCCGSGSSLRRSRRPSSPSRCRPVLRSTARMRANSTLRLKGFVM